MKKRNAWVVHVPGYSPFTMVMGFIAAYDEALAVARSIWPSATVT